MRVYLSIICFLMPFFLLGQKQWREKQYTYYDGLPSDGVHYTCLSKKGYLYVFTQRGLSVFDGYRFVSSEHINKGVFNQYLHNDTLFYEDMYGLNKMDVSSRNSTPIEISSKIYADEDPNNDHFDNLFVDGTGRIWCSDFQHIKYLSPKAKSFHSYAVFPKDNKHIERVSFLEINSQEIWTLTTDGIWVWKNNQFSKHENALLARNHFTATYKLDETTLCLVTNEYFYVWDIQNNRLKNTFSNHIGSLLGFMQCNHELFGYNEQSIFRLNTNTFDSELSYSSKFKINHVQFDAKANCFWASTANGLTQIILPNKAIESFWFDESEIVIDMVSHSKSIYAVTNLGAVWKFQNKKWKKIHQKNDVEAQCIDKIEQRIFVGTNKGLLEIKNDHCISISLTHFPKDKVIKKMLLTLNKELWMVFDKEKVYKYSYENFNFLSNHFANEDSFWIDNLWNDALVDANGTIWLIGWMPKGYGITKYNLKTNQFIDISHKAINKDRGRFVGDYYNRVFETKEKNLLFSAYGGFNRTNSQGNIIQKVDINTYEILDGYLTGISENQNQNVFFATKEGLHIYRKDLDQVVRLSKADGLPTDYLINGYEVLENGYIALGVPGGITIVDPELALKSPLTNQLEISYISVNGTIRYIENNRFELNPDERNLNIYFSDLSYLDAFKVSYLYRINDSKEWIALGHQPELSFNNLSPGTYQITIQAMDHLGNVQEKELQICFKSHPPFTKSIAFYLLIGLCVIVIILLTNNYFIKRKQKEKEFLSRIKDAEMTTLRSQMNPHFMFNTLNSINSYIIQNQTKDASKYLTSFSKLMRNILDNSKHKMITLEKELQTLKLYMELESARLEHFFDYTFSVDKKIDVQNTKIPPLIIQPFVENAIWHGLRDRKTGHISIHCRYVNNETIAISIEDNGIGREQSMLLKNNQTSHKSYGVEITSDRLQMVNPENKVELFDLYDDQGNALGTRVVLTLKMETDD